MNITEQEIAEALADAELMNQNMRLYGCIDVPKSIQKVTREFGSAMDIHCGDDSPDPISKAAYNHALGFVTKQQQKHDQMMELIKALDDAWNSYDGKERFGKLMIQVEEYLEGIE